MSLATDDPSPTTCKMCTKIIFWEDEPVHFHCVATKEKQLTEMVSFLHSQVIAMKKAFSAVEGVIKNLGIALNVDYSPVEDDVRFPANRNLRQSTKDKSQQINQQKSSKKTVSSKRNTVSPLVVPNVTSKPSDEIVISMRNNKTTVSTVSTSSSSSSNTLIPVLVEEDENTNRELQAAQEVNDRTDDDCCLPVVPPLKSIFLSRLRVDVTTDQVHNYIKNKVQGAENITVRKLLFREPRIFSSFEIKVGYDLNLFDALLQPAVWPQHSVVHEFKRFLREPRTYSNLQ